MEEVPVLPLVDTVHLPADHGRLLISPVHLALHLPFVVASVPLPPDPYPSLDREPDHPLPHPVADYVHPHLFSSPRDRRYRGGGGGRDSRSPPPRRRRISPGPARSISRSLSRSRSPPSKRNNLRRQRSASPPRRRLVGGVHRGPELGHSHDRRSPPPKRRSFSGDRGGKRGRRYSRSQSSTRSKRDDDAMDIDGGGLKIKGQAEAQRRRSKWEDDSARDVRIHHSEI